MFKMNMEMKSSLVLGAILLLCSSQIHGTLFEDVSNELQQSPFILEEFLRFSKIPQSEIYQKIGNPINLECSLAGSPAPTVEWVQGNEKFTKIDNRAFNIITESSLPYIARVRSILRIDNVLLANTNFTCIGRSAGKIIHATTLVHAAPEITDKTRDISEILEENRELLSKPISPKINYHYMAVISTIGSNVLLKCHAIGNPKPEILWFNSAGVINGNKPKLTILPNKDLLIRNLQFSDLDGYRCVARNSEASDMIETFVYPARPEN